VSILVELPPQLYSPVAFAAFDPASGFSIGNARAMMWFSQLAYETGKPGTIAEVAPVWGFTAVTPFVRRNVAIAASFETCGLIGERPDAVVLAFAGTDPAVWETLATDINVRLTADRDTHIGFQSALDAVRPEIGQAVRQSRQSRPLFVTGHSLGGALAALAAQHADGLPDAATPRAVYVYGMPRAGGVRFSAAYNATLGPFTYRLVHGQDIVARVPMSGLGYRHVGRVLACGSGERFDAAALSAAVTDEPQFSKALLDGVVGGIAGVFRGHILSPPGPGPVGPLLRFLPQAIRDHLPDRYYGALAG